MTRRKAAFDKAERDELLSVVLIESSCDMCMFLGGWIGRRTKLARKDIRFDLYFCPDTGSVVCRYSDRGRVKEEWCTVANFLLDDEPAAVLEAYRRAVQQGLVKEVRK